MAKKMKIGCKMKYRLFFDKQLTKIIFNSLIMKKLFAFLLFTLILSVVNAQVSKTVNVITPGNLSSLLTETEKTTVTDLTVTGNIDARDFKCMRDAMSALAILDISSVNIRAYQGTGGTSNSGSDYLANEMPGNSFNYSSGAGKITLKSISLPVTMTSIGSYSFYNCSGLSEITISNSIKTIGERSFSGCTGLKTVSIGNLVTSIGNMAFFNCSGLTNLTIGSGITSIGENTFYNCSKLTSLVILSSIWDNSFTNCTQLSSVIIGDRVTSIGENSFYGCTGLTSLTLPNSVRSISKNSFYGCVGLTSLTLSNSLKSIGDNAFYGCVGLTSLIIPDSVSSIGEVSFYGIAGLTSLTIGNGINSIPYACFAECTNIKVLRCLNSNPPIVENSGFDSVNPTVVYVPVGTLAAYKAAAIWKDFPTIYEYILNVSTQSVSSVNTTAKLKGSINVIADTPVIAHGFCWNTTGSPTIADNKVDNGVATVTGSFTDSITGLIPKTTYYVKAFASNGERTVYGNEMQFTVSLLPETAGIITGMQTICQGETAVIYTVPEINNAISYTWTLPSGATGTSTSNTIQVNYTKDAISGTLSVKGHNDGGDGDSSSLSITVNQLPLVELRDTAVISGGSVPLSPTITYTGTGNLNYKWTPSTGLSSDNIAQPIATVIGRTSYTLVVTTPTGCSNSAHVTVNILPMAPPQIGIVGVTDSGKNRIVWNKPVTTGIASYFIYKETNSSNLFEKIGIVPYDSLSVFVDTQSFPDIKSDKYKLSIFDRNGMESPFSDAHKTIHLSINKGQNNRWNLIWESYEGFNVSTYNIYRGTNSGNLNFLDATSGSSTQYSDLSAPAGDVYYQLEVVSSNLINPTKAPAMQKSKDSENSDGSVLVSYNSSRSNIASNSVSDVNDLDGDNTHINIYPNPVKDNFRIDFEGGSTFEILNLMGQVVYNGDLMKNTIVQTSSLSSGIYMLKFKTGKTYKYRKFIKD